MARTAGSAAGRARRVLSACTATWRSSSGGSGRAATAGPARPGTRRDDAIHALGPYDHDIDTTSTAMRELAAEVIVAWRRRAAAGALFAPG